MQQNMYLRRGITAARDLYNDKSGYTTKIPFVTSKKI